MRDEFEHLSFHLGGPHDSRRNDHLEGCRVVGLASLYGCLEGAHDGLSERVAHDDDAGGLFVLNSGEQFVAVERTRWQCDDAATHEVGDECAKPQARAMHERAAGNADDLIARADDVGDSRCHERCLGDRRSADQWETAGDEAAGHAAHRVHHALGHAGGAAGVEHVDV